MCLCAPPLVETLLRCPPCLQTASHAAASSISEWDQSCMDWYQGSMEGVGISPTTTSAKCSEHKLQCGLLHYHGGLLHCLEELDVSSAMYDRDSTAGIHSRIPWLSYAKMIMTFVGDGFCWNLCLCGEPRWCHSFYCLFCSGSYARAQVSSSAIISLRM